jgi:hypothetical protein
LVEMILFCFYQVFSLLPRYIWLKDEQKKHRSTLTRLNGVFSRIMINLKQIKKEKKLSLHLSILYCKIGSNLIIKSTCIEVSLNFTKLKMTTKKLSMN